MRVPSADFEAFRTCTCRSTHVFPTVVTVASLAAHSSQNNNNNNNKTLVLLMVFLSTQLNVNYTVQTI